MDKKIEEFEKLLKNVSDSYSDFVEDGVIQAKKTEGYIEKITEFIKNNPDANTSDIIRFEADEIFHIPDVEFDEDDE